MKELRLKLESVINEALSLNEMAPFISTCSFDKFYQICKERYEYIKARSAIEDKQKSLYQYPPLPYEDKMNAQIFQNILVTNESLEHVWRRHPKIGLAEWKAFLKCFDPSKDYREIGRSGGWGQKYIYKCADENTYYGYVIRIFTSADPQMVTMFTGSQAEVDNWFNTQKNTNEKDID